MGIIFHLHIWFCKFVCVPVCFMLNLAIGFLVSRFPMAKILRFIASDKCFGAITCLQHYISALWSLRYQMYVSKQHPRHPLFSTVLSCIWHEKGRGCGCHFFKKMGLSSKNKSREKKGRSSSAHLEEIFNVDTRHYFQGHRKVRTNLNAEGMVTPRGFKITKVKWGKGVKTEQEIKKKQRSMEAEKDGRSV